MTDDTRPVAQAALSSTLLIVRDSAEGIEIFMVVRHHKIDFASGAFVFPGGKVDPQDRDPQWSRHMRPHLNGLDPAILISACRETFEEAGFVLARRPGEETLLGATECHRLVFNARADVLAGTRPFVDLMRAENLELATDLLVPFAHWLTPVSAPKRFDTHFLLVRAPVDQLGSHDGHESVDSVWITPGQALSEADQGLRTLLPPTRLNLQKLARHATVAQAMAEAAVSPVITVLPRLSPAPGGFTLTIPESAGYGVTSMFLPTGP